MGGKPRHEFRLDSMKSTSANALEVASPSRTSNPDVSGTQTASLVHVMSELTGLDETRVRTFGSDLADPVVDVAANRPNLFDCSLGSAAGLTALTESSNTGSRGSFGGGNGRGGQDDVGRSAVVPPLLVPGRADPSNCCIGSPEFGCGVCEGGQVLRSPSNRRLGTADRVAPYPSSLPKQDSGSSPAFTRYAENMAGDYAKSMTSPKATLPKVLEPPGAPRKKNGKPLETSHRRNLNRAACRRIAF